MKKIYALSYSSLFLSLGCAMATSKYPEVFDPGIGLTCWVIFIIFDMILAGSAVAAVILKFKNNENNK